MDKLKPIKSLGQNFLQDEHILQKIAGAAGISGDDVVLEIGAGPGNLTKYLCEKAKFVYAVEKDARLCRIAEENLKEFENVKIICGDILKIDVNNVGGRHACPLQLKVVGNLPYYITTPIIFHLLGQRKYISDIIIMIQKEVAERITANPGGPPRGASKDYGVLSCSTQFYTKPEILFSIKKGAFKPQPKVDSTLLRLRPFEKPSVLVKSEAGFLKIIKAAFSQRRKTLLNSLSNGLKLKRQEAEVILSKAGIAPSRRAETLSLEEFAAVANLLL